MEDIAELLKETREEAGIDLEEVSKDLNIDVLMLSNIEDGKIGAFKDIFVLKDYISNYAKYLGLNCDKIINDFNEYLFEYTSKIPVAQIEKEIQQNQKEDVENKMFSPYTKPRTKNQKNIYVMIYILLFILVILTIFWSINKITIEKQNASIISYRK